MGKYIIKNKIKAKVKNKASRKKQIINTFNDNEKTTTVYIQKELNVAIHKTVYESENIEDSWDGAFQGKPVDVDTYFYMIEAYVSDNSNPAIIKGDVTVIR